MKKLVLLATAILSVAIYFSCRREQPFMNNQASSISAAKNWFEAYQSKEHFDTAFKNLQYHWEKAATFTFENGYKVVTVPITETNQNAAYTGRRILYLYPWKNGKGYYSTIWELIPELAHVQKRKGNMDLKTFSGFISTWDLKRGFVRGATFSNGVPEKNIQIERKQIRGNNNTINNAPSLPTTSPGTLSAVAITKVVPAPDYGYYWITLTNSLGYSTNYLWDGGGVSNSGGGNPCEYTDCNHTANPYDYFDENMLNELFQDLQDKQWQREQIKDYTNNRCAGSVITSLTEIKDKLPGLIRSFFSADANFSMTIKMDYRDTWQGEFAPSGARTVFNTTSNQFEVFLNSYYNNVTDLGTASTIIHEAFHCQIMNWYREADAASKKQLATEYWYLFPPDSISISDLQAVINGGNETQHEFMANRYRNIIAEALYQFAQSKGLSVDLDYCKDLAWGGIFDSEAFKKLSKNTQKDIRGKCNAEKDPYAELSDPNGDYTVNSDNITPKGSPCRH